MTTFVTFTRLCEAYDVVVKIILCFTMFCVYQFTEHMVRIYNEY